MIRGASWDNQTRVVYEREGGASSAKSLHLPSSDVSRCYGPRALVFIICFFLLCVRLTRHLRVSYAASKPDNR